MNYLDILPNELLEHINNFVLLLYQNDHRNKFKFVVNELNDQWLWVLWNADIYVSSNNFYNILPFESERKKKIIKYMKTQDNMRYIKPSLIFKTQYLKELKENCSSGK